MYDQEIANEFMKQGSEDAACDRAATAYASAHMEPVSTLTHSTAYVAKHFLQWREKQKVKPAPKVRVANKTNGGLKGAAFALYSDGYSAKQVSTELNITYANAHYYKRAMAK